ncbi:MAG: hypothetical protein Q7R52_00395 [archaeon]|nr:hypothetical protein [archaeon]
MARCTIICKNGRRCVKEKALGSLCMQHWLSKHKMLSKRRTNQEIRD